MSNYTFVVNSKYKARTFEDLLKPLAMYTQEYNAQEDAMNELATKADVWDGMANEETDPIAYAQYKTYADDLRGQAEALAANGLNPITRRNVLALKRRYASEIVPIEQAYTTRKEQADEQRKALLQNPTLLLSRRAATTSLDKYLENPQLGYESYSGALLTQQVGQAAATLAKELRSYGRSKNLDSYTNTWLQQHGFKSNDVLQAINNPDDPRSSKVLNAIVNTAIANSGVANWADTSTLNQAYNYARQGLWQAVGQTQVSPFENYGARLAAQEASEKRVAKYKKDIENANPPGGNHLQLNPIALRSQREITEANKKIQDYIRKGYLKQNARGEYVLTPKGRKEYDTTYNRSVVDTSSKYGKDSNIGYSTRKVKTSSSFKIFMDSLGAGKYRKAGKSGAGNWGPWQDKMFGALFGKYVRDNEPGSYDTNRTTGYTFNITDDSQRENLNSAMGHFYGQQGYKEVEYQGGKFKETHRISGKDLAKYVPTSIINSQYGLVAVYTNKEDATDTHLIEIPVGVGNEEVKGNLVLAAKDADIAGHHAREFKQRGDQASYLDAEETYKRLGDYMYHYTSDLFQSLKTKPTEITTIAK